MRRLLTVIIIGLSLSLKAQVPGGIDAYFLKNFTLQKTTEVASNVLKIINNTPGGKQIHILLNLPSSRWQTVGSGEKDVFLKKGDSAFIPVRIIPDKNAAGNTNYFISASLYVNDVQIGFTSWNIKIEKQSRWHAYLTENKVYFPSGHDSVLFSFTVRNEGNSPEELMLELFPYGSIDLVDTLTQSVHNNFSFTLAPFESRDFIYYAIIRHEKQKNNGSEEIFTKKTEEEKYSVKIKIRNQGTDQGGGSYWSGNVDLISLPDEMSANERGYQSLPINIEFNVYDLLTQRLYSTLDLFGNARFPGNRTLVYYFQTPFTQQYFNPSTYLGQYHFLSYESNHFYVGLGSVNSGRPASYLSGKGIQAAYRWKQHTLSAIWVRNPDFLKRRYMEGYGLGYRYQNSRWYVDPYLQYKDDYFNKVKSSTGTVFSSYQFNRNHLIRVGFGLSREQHYWKSDSTFTLPGMYYTFLYSGQFRKFRFNALNYYGSKNYPDFRGLFSASLNTYYQWNEYSSLGLEFTHMENNPELYKNGERLNLNIYSRKDLFDIRWTRFNDNFTISVMPFIEYYDYQQLRTLNKSVSFDFRQRSNAFVRFYVTAIAGYLKALDYDIKDFFVANLRTSMRIGRFLTNIRYYYGPFYTREQLDYLETKIFPQRLYLSAYYDQWLFNSKTLLTFTTDYNYSTRYKRGLLSARPEIFYFTPYHLRISAYCRYYLFTENQDELYIQGITDEPAPKTVSQRFEIGFGVKKELGIPVSFKKFKDLKIIVFKDYNGNGKQEISEPGIKDILISLQRIDSNQLNTDELYIDHSKHVYELVTNKKGIVVFNNIPSGDYLVTTYPLSSQKGWYDGKKITVNLDRDKIVLIPLKKGVKLTGNLFVERDKYSQYGEFFNLANIRVSCMDSAGNITSALTDANGNFSMFLPAGYYVVTVNEAALGKRFHFVRNNIPVHLTQEMDNFSISFTIIEKARTLKVRKFDSQGNLIEEKSVNSRMQGSSAEQEEKPDASLQSSPIEKQPENQPAGTGTPDKEIHLKINRIENKLDNIEQRLDEIDRKVSTGVYKTGNISVPASVKGSRIIGSEGSIITRNISLLPAGQLSSINADEFYIILGSFKIPNNAVDAVTMFREKGFSTVIIYNEIRDWYYVCLNSYFTYREALNKYKELKKQNIDNWIYFLDQENKFNR